MMGGAAGVAPSSSSFSAATSARVHQHLVNNTWATGAAAASSLKAANVGRYNAHDRTERLDPTP
eukprot:1194352-Prorocentrum_minimum.AAC.1